ncbi:MAG: PBP1A family penicillin-binding protein [Acidobacteriota bacterium]|nr:PBP1A family penicillin-binding protein [Acidobacteriota bacterium]
MKKVLGLGRRGWIIIVSLHIAAAAGGVALGLVLLRDLPGIDRMDIARLSRVTILLDRHGAQLHSLGEQRRIPVTLDRVSPWLIKAVVATEDPRFMRHFGVDLKAVARAAIRNLTSHWGAEGASTITMQLARDEFLNRRKTLYRKALEAVYATQIELHYSKEDILTHYCNRVYLGHGRYGVEAASRLYFGISAAELDLPRAALLAGLIQAPERLTPFRHPQRALNRRNHVLKRMAVEGVIEPALAEKAQKAPLGLRERTPTPPRAPYFIEEVRRWLMRQYGEEAVYREGLVARTTLEPRLQQAAENAVTWGLDQYGRRHRELPEPRPLPEGTTPEEYRDPSWYQKMEEGRRVLALVEEVSADSARVRIARRSLELGLRAIRWTGRKSFEGLLEPGTLVPVRVLAVDGEGLPARVDVASDTRAQAALIAIDAATGDILALVGGKDFSRSEFDLAMQARRQAGSAFKPFIFASALEMGMLPNQQIYDTPTAVVDPGSPEPYQPENYERDYEGYVTLRHALEHSRNIPTIRLLDAIGYQPAVEMARRLGIATDLKPYPSLALGAFEVKLVDLVAAYAAFVNGGVLVTPRLVREVRHSDQRTLFRAETEAEEVLSPEVSAMMVSLLEGVVLHGTGRRAQTLGRPVGGKTGTTDEYTDAWFVGFTPSIAVGVWVGLEQRESLGKRETGARAALPIWTRFLDRGLAGEPIEEFLRPPGVRRTLVDAATGLRSRRGAPCGKVILETFPRNREPRRACSARENRRLTLPYPLQVYPIDENGALLIPPEDAARILSLAPDRLSLLRGGRRLRWAWGKKNGTIELAWSREERLAFYDALPMAADEAALRREAIREFREEYERKLEEMRAAGEDTEALPGWEQALPAELRSGVDGWPAEVLVVNRSGRLRLPRHPVDPGESR